MAWDGDADRESVRVSQATVARSLRQLGLARLGPAESVPPAGGTISAQPGHSARDHTTRFPGVAAAVRALGRAPLVLEGGVAVFDAQLLSRFEWIRHRQPPDLATPPVFIAFDCLQAKGKDLRVLPLHRRRAVLEELLDDQALVLPVRRLAGDGLQAWQHVIARGYEGLVAKDPASPYRGGRTLSLLKVKQSTIASRNGAGVSTSAPDRSRARHARRVPFLRAAGAPGSDGPRDSRAGDPMLEVLKDRSCSE